MNEVVNKFLLAGDKVMPELHLRQLGFTYSTWWPFAKYKKRMQTFKETGDSRHFYQNELDKACFQHDMAYQDFKDVARRTASDKYYVIKHLILLEIQNMMDSKEVWLYCFNGL